MHIRGRADPDDVDIRESEQVRPVLHGRGVRRIFPAEFFRALVAGIRDRHDFDLVMLFQPRQVPPAHNVPCPDNSDSQLLMIRPAHVVN